MQHVQLVILRQMQYNVLIFFKIFVKIYFLTCLNKDKNDLKIDIFKTTLYVLDTNQAICYVGFDIKISMRIKFGFHFTFMFQLSNFFQLHVKYKERLVQLPWFVSPVKICNTEQINETSLEYSHHWRVIESTSIITKQAISA